MPVVNGTRRPVDDDSGGPEEVAQLLVESSDVELGVPVHRAADLDISVSLDRRIDHEQHGGETVQVIILKQINSKKELARTVPERFCKKRDPRY